ncbi:MAG TPA: biotin/lipoyl-binding protein [Thermoanaerobaculia bacterium]|nr:biotin/lipoyl-binding protein [Thermoanaerobaculia bacterium]
MNRIGALLLSILLIAAVGCGASASEEAAQTDAAKSEAASEAGTTPELPSDVQDVASIAKSETTPETPGVIDGETAEGTVAATGELVAPVTSEVAVRMPGRVGKVFADEGERVRRGQPLLTLETQYLSLELKRAEADVARARAAAADAERDFKRKEELIAKGSVARAAYDRSQSSYDAAQAGGPRPKRPATSPASDWPTRSSTPPSRGWWPSAGPTWASGLATPRWPTWSSRPRRSSSASSSPSAISPA